MTDEDPQGRNVSLQFTPSYLIAQQCPCSVLLVSIKFGGFMCKTFMSAAITYHAKSTADGLSLAALGHTISVSTGD